MFRSLDPVTAGERIQYDSDRSERHSPGLFIPAASASNFKQLVNLRWPHVEKHLLDASGENLTEIQNASTKMSRNFSFLQHNLIAEK